MLDFFLAFFGLKVEGLSRLVTSNRDEIDLELVLQNIGRVKIMVLRKIWRLQSRVYHLPRRRRFRKVDQRLLAQLEDGPHLLGGLRRLALLEVPVDDADELGEDFEVYLIGVNLLKLRLELIQVDINWLACDRR